MSVSQLSRVCVAYVSNPVLRLSPCGPPDTIFEGSILMHASPGGWPGIRLSGLGVHIRHVIPSFKSGHHVRPSNQKSVYPVLPVMHCIYTRPPPPSRPHEIPCNSGDLKATFGAGLVCAATAGKRHWDCVTLHDVELSESGMRSGSYWSFENLTSWPRALHAGAPPTAPKCTSCGGSPQPPPSALHAGAVN